MEKSGAQCAELVQPAASVAHSSGSFSVEPSHVSEDATVKAPQMLLNLIVGGLGTGMLSLPWAMAGASILVGAVIIVLVIGVNLWTIMILVHASERYQVFDLGALLGKLPGRLGPGMQTFVNLMVWIVLYGSLLSYIIGICDSAQPFIQGTFFEQRWALAGAACLIVLPLCFLDQKYLSFSSGAAIIVNLYLMILVGVEFFDRLDRDNLPHSICEFGLAKGSVTMASTMMQSVIIQMCVLPMYKELENRSPDKFGRILLMAFSTLAVLFIFLSVAGYVAFGPTVNSNLLVSLPHNTAMNVASRNDHCVGCCLSCHDDRNDSASEKPPVGALWCRAGCCTQEVFGSCRPDGLFCGRLVRSCAEGEITGSGERAGWCFVLARFHCHGSWVGWPAVTWTRRQVLEAGHGFAPSLWTCWSSGWLCLH